jgi:hypothetical protein
VTPVRRALAAAFAFVHGPVGATRLVVFRLLLAHSLLIYMLFRWQESAEWLTPAGYHPSGAASGGMQQPVPLLTEAALPWFGAAYFASIAALIFGVRPRLTIWLVAAGTIYVTLADRLAAFTINKLFVASLLVLALAPPIRTDAAGRLRTRSAWALRALQLTFVLQVWGAGVCKVRFGDWVGHDDTLWHQVQLTFMTDLAAWMVRDLPMWLWALLQHLALGFELAAPLLFLVPRLRPLGYLMGFGMFAIISATMHELIFFALQLVCFFALFVDEDRLHRWRAAVLRRLG